MKTGITVISFFTALTLFNSCKKNTGTINPTPQTDSFTVTVNNGYGSGKYKTGDTVHIFSQNYSDNQLFNKWSGDSSVLNNAEEWHTWFIMPDKNVSFTGRKYNSFHFKVLTDKRPRPPKTGLLLFSCRTKRNSLFASRNRWQHG